LNKYIKEERKKEEESVSGSSWSLVFKSKHLRNLSAIVGVSVVVAKLVDYQFNDLSNKVYTNPDELASFFGFWFSTFNIIALLIQLFLTNRFMSRFGVTTNMMFLPMGLAIGSFLFFVFPELWVMVLIKGMDGSFKQSLNKAAYELSFLPVSYDVKKQAKPFIDVVIDSIATGLTGFLLLFLIHKLNLEAKYFTFIIMFFLILWVYLIFRLRESYFDTFRKNISELVYSKKKGKRKKKKNSVETMIDILNSGSEKEILALLRHMNDDMSEMFRPYMIRLLDHPSDRVKASAIKEIYDFKDIHVIKKLNDLIEKSNDDQVVYEAMEYLLAHSEVTKEKALHYLEHRRDFVKNAALLCLARSSRYNRDLAKKYDLDQRIVSQIKEFTEYEDIQRKEEIAALLLTIGYYGKKEYFYVIDKYLASKEPLLVKYAIKAAGRTKSDVFVDKLLVLMTDKENHDDVVKALKGYGDSMVNVLYNKDRDEEFDENIRGYIPEIIQAFETKESVVMLMRLLESKDVFIRLNAARSLNKLEDKNHKLRFSSKRLNDLIFNETMYFKNTMVAIQSVENAFDKTERSVNKEAYDNVKAQTARRTLLKHLQKQLDYSLETIFNLLAIKYTDADMKVAFYGIKNDTEESRINSIEFLSNLLEVELKKELLPLLEYRFLGDNETNIDIKPVSEIRSLINLINEQGIVSKTLVLRLMHFIQHKSAKGILKKLLKHKNPKIRTLARKNLEM
jgi:AAA family ATP:ADP antiporter